MSNFEKCSDRGESLSDLHDANGWIEPEKLDDKDLFDVDEGLPETDNLMKEFEDVFEVIAGFSFKVVTRSVRDKLLYNSERRILSGETFP